MSDNIFKQPPKVKAKVMEYRPPNWKRLGDEWIIGDWEAMSQAFSVHEADLRLWHEVVVGQGRHWQVVRLLYLIRPALYLEGDAVDFVKTWSIDSIAQKLGHSAALIEQDLAQITLHWKQRASEVRTETEVSNPFKPSVKGQQVEAPTPALPQETTLVENMSPKVQEFLPKFRAQRMADEEAQAIIDALNLGPIADHGIRMHIAARALAFQQWLEKPITRENACQILRHEINLSVYQGQLQKIAQSLNTEKDSKRITELTRDYRDIEARYAALTATYQSQLDDLGGDMAVREDMKREALDTLGFVTQAIRAYRARGDRRLIDGVFTADEIKWLLTPVPLRPAQYRVDIVAVVRDAMKPENIFDENYKPPKITREVCRNLSRMMQIFESEIGIKEQSIHAEIEAPIAGEEELPSAASASPSSPPVDLPTQGDAPAPAFVPAFMMGKKDEPMISVSNSQ